MVAASNCAKELLPALSPTPTKAIT
ncbi:transcriptional regulator-like protein [Acidithiobacillus caldus]|nr:transcriptional regulator-like protein [Acidithiobacillus caldus]